MALCFVSYRKKRTDYTQYAQAESEGLSEQRVEEPTLTCVGGSNWSVENVAGRENFLILIDIKYYYYYYTKKDKMGEARDKDVIFFNRCYLASWLHY